MRVLKFRAWDVENQIWTFVTLGDMICGACLSSGDKPLSGAPQIWEQSTGLLDRNGKEIYEGDIVKCWDEDCGEVYFDTISLQYRVKFSDGDEEDLASAEPEIIGNIHEPPKDFRPEHLKRMGVTMIKG